MTNRDTHRITEELETASTSFFDLKRMRNFNNQQFPELKTLVIVFTFHNLVHTIICQLNKRSTHWGKILMSVNLNLNAL